MAMDQFLKLQDVTGEAQDKNSPGHAGEIDVLAWSWGLSQSASAHMGTGGGSAKVTIQDVAITKYIDKSSTVLFKFACSGKHIPTGTLVVRKAGGDSPIEYITIDMEEIVISSVSLGGSGGEDRLTEHVTLNFGKCKLNYTPQKDDGTPDVVMHGGWDIAGNVDNSA